MNTLVMDHSTVKASLSAIADAIQKASELADAVVADEVSFVKSYRRPLMTLGLFAGGLIVAFDGGLVGVLSQP